VRLKHTALLTGPYDWDPALVPVQEFEARLAEVQHVLAKYQESGLVAHGNSAEYGALAYLTGFVPKLGPAFALVGRDRSVRLLVSGSPTMLSAAKRLTWIKDVRPVGDLRASIASWLSEGIRDERVAIGLWGSCAMAWRPYKAISTAIKPYGKMVDLGAPLEALRQRKSSWEHELSRQASRILHAAIRPIARVGTAGAGARSAALAAEHEAFVLGAQDVRILASARNGGPPLALDGPSDAVVDPLLAYVAVRFAGYWAEGFITVSRSPLGALRRAEDGLGAMLQRARAGVTFKELASFAEKHLSPYRIHPLVEHSIGNSIGLSLEEPCDPAPEETGTLQESGVYTLRCGAMGEGSDNAIVSAMMRIGHERIEVLWSGLGESKANDAARASL